MKAVPTVYELRKKGWKIRVGHHRIYFRYDPFTGRKSEVQLLKAETVDYDGWYLSPYGGRTVITITLPGTSGDLIGISECSEQEHYRRKVGVKKALARALSLWLQNTDNKLA